MPNYINISLLENTNIYWEKQLSGGELQQVRNAIKGHQVVAILPATLKPVRTNNCKNFAKDFFLPATVNHAIKVQHLVAKVFAILFSLILDLSTLAIRLLTCIPRAVSNARQPKNPLHSYLTAQQGINKKLLAADHVKVKLVWESVSNFGFSEWTDADGVFHRQRNMDLNWKEECINFIEQPIYEGYDLSCSGISLNKTIK